MSPAEFNPFQALTFIVAPAMITNASSLMVLATANRFARAIDRARLLAAQVEAHPQDPRRNSLVIRMNYAQRRARLLVRALTCFYLAVGSFAAASFSSLVGAGLATGGDGFAYEVSIGAALVAGLVGVSGMIFGSGLLVWETRMALAMLLSETESILEHAGPARAEEKPE
ncbi:MAG TPA: DUF2721 domain-containing protein [Pirellulales bacterium]